MLTFSKPMDPAGASNVNNYAVRSTYATSSVFGGSLGYYLVWVPESHFQELGAAPGRRVRSRDELGDAHPQAKADLQEPDHRDPGVRVEEVVTARTPVGRPPRSHRLGRQSDQWGLDPRKILGFRHDRGYAACYDRGSAAWYDRGSAACDDRESAAVASTAEAEPVVSRRW